MLWLGPGFSKGSGSASAGGRGPRRHTDTHEVGCPLQWVVFRSPDHLTGQQLQTKVFMPWFLILGWEPTFVPVKDPSWKFSTPEWLWNGFCVVFIHIFHDRECVFGGVT